MRRLIVGVLAGLLAASVLTAPAHAETGTADTLDEQSQYEAQLRQQAATADDAVPGDRAAMDAAEDRAEQDRRLDAPLFADAALALADPSDFTPGNLIADSNFRDGDAMTENQIQDFLQQMVGTCANSSCLASYTSTTPDRTWSFGDCAPYDGAVGESAARIIFKVQEACGLNAKVILVILQKEQSLLTNPAPSAETLRKAMGYGCPDTAACDSTYYGFFNQVYAAARQLTWYGNPEGSFTWLEVGRPNHVLYHPDAARCGGADVTIANAATAALYYYTPYQPNAAALANLYGEGDSCSSYGNRNFWRMYSDWFGDPRVSRELSSTRLEGEDRYATAAAISVAGHPGAGVPVVYVASGSDFADALSAAPAAAHRGGPLLLVTRDGVPEATAAELVRLAPQEIVIVGGEGAIGAAVANELAAIATTRRIGGVDRYDTSRRLVDDAFGTVHVAYLATGLDFPDGLSAGAAAGALDAPVLLVDGRLSGMDPATAGLLGALGVREIRLAGGTSAITAGIEASARADSLIVKRYAGVDRYGTSSSIVSGVFTASSRTYVATGLQFPDALAGAAAAGEGGDPLVLARSTCVPGPVRSTVLALGVTSVTLLGGTAALADPVGRLQGC